jgi:hypothetical protein
MDTPILTERNAAGAHIIPAPARRTLAQLAQEALDVQDACNLSGVALGFGRAMADLRHVIGGGDELRRHPVTVLWLDKLNDMTGRVDGYAVFSTAYAQVQAYADGRAASAEVSA